MQQKTTGISQFSQRLQRLHQSLTSLQPDITRVAVALYNETLNNVNTYAYSSTDLSPLTHYAMPLDQVPTLKAIHESGKPRVINDMQALATDASLHTQKLLDAGFRSSYTVPVMHAGRLLGFIFFNSTRAHAFSNHLLPHLEITAYAISLLILNEKAALRTLEATMNSAIEVTHVRNPETGEHLKRIASYTRLIARQLAERYLLDDEYIERLALFSSLHDIGKISIPDAILLKPGPLTAEEFEVMKTHTVKGRVLIDALIRNHALEMLDHIDLLRNIVEGHHECWDGSGYPHGLCGEEIPLEARIIAVGDVFDALTSERPYKDRMGDEQAFAILQEMSGKKLDPDCVRVFLEQREEVIAIREQFADIHPTS